MKAKIIQVGNSKGIRLPKPLIEQVGLAEEVELEVREGQIVISPAVRPRRGWADAARALSTRGEDRQLDKALPTTFDQEEWEW
ncbi:MAG: AbrB/MazE/SpoVT family DNA-binding domain-containing protein [Phycisphaerae bacterium]|nr:AbrB/MazE/SpoVT family DNA-binding domain-containing protein [Phycisphaerae bacterium]